MYTERLANAQVCLRDIKAEIEFLKLQIKQEAKQVRWAKGSPGLKAILRDKRISAEHGAGMTYLAIHLSVLESYAVPDGWEMVEQTRQRNIGDPVCTKYRKQGFPALLYVTKEVH